MVDAGWAQELLSTNSLGIMLGLGVGKPVGIVAATFAAVALGICRLPLDLAWRHILSAGLLGFDWLKFLGARLASDPDPDHGLRQRAGALKELPGDP